jgi:small subunit ribosomal protein S7
MRSKVKIRKKDLLPDPKYNSVFVAKFINRVLKQGKKATAQKLVYSAFDIIFQKTKKSPEEVFDEAIRNAGPPLEVRPKRIGGANYQIPMEVPRDRKVALAMRWLVEAARKRSGQSMDKALAAEIIDAYERTGSVIKKREDLIKMAEANRAFAHYARM